MTTPTPAPASMTAGKLKSLRETTEGNIRSRALRGLAPGSYATDIALLDHIDALTARVATLEEENKAFWPVVPDEETKLMLAVLDVVASGQKTLSASAAQTAASLITRLSIERGQYREAMETYSAGMTKAVACQAKAESELAAARKVEDKEVSEFIDWLRLEQNEPGISAGLAWRYERTQQLLSALSAALKEAERQVVDWTVRTGRQVERADKAEARAQAAEAQLKEVRKHSREAYDHLCSNAIESVRRSRAMELLRLVIALQTKDTTP